MRLRNSFSTIVQSVLQQRQRHTSHLGSKHEATTYVESHCTLLQLPKKMFRFSGLCSLQKIRLPRSLGACPCYLLPQCCSICGNGLTLFKTFQRIEVALAGAEAHCRIERILQPLIPTQFCPLPNHQTTLLARGNFLHGPIRLCEQSPKFQAALSPRVGYLSNMTSKAPCLTRSSVYDGCFSWCGCLQKIDPKEVFFSNHFLKGIHKPRGASWQTQIPTSPDSNLDFNQIRSRLRDRCKPRSGSMAFFWFHCWKKRNDQKRT